MLNENIKRIRKSKGLSQEELAIKLNVVRQTVSKWENGLSVPDSSMLIILANELNAFIISIFSSALPDSIANFSEGMYVSSGTPSNRSEPSSAFKPFLLE